MLVSLFALAALVLAYALLPLPPALDHPTPATLTLLDRRGALIAELPSPTARVQEPIPLADMGSWLPKVTVALEDHRFYTHHGVDCAAAIGSLWRNARSGRIIGGASTITQQLIKLASGRQHRSWSAKIYEALAAWKLERRWSKAQILTEYLNRSDYGNRLVGPQAAARWYFAKAPRDLTLAEAAFLAGLPQAPSRYNPWTHRARADARFQRTIAALTAHGAIDPSEAATLAQATVNVGKFVPHHEAPHFVQALRREAPSAAGTVRTTLDLALQHTVEELTRAHLRSLNRGDISGAAVVVLQNSTGAVRALLGSPDFQLSQINGALTPRSCGSTLKPFLYLRGIDSHTLTAASVLPDTPEAIRDAYADYDPQDYNKRSLGPVRVREALACSLNVPAVVALSRIGARRVFFDLNRWGFRLPRGLDEYGAGFILGNAEIRLLDLASAYAGLAEGGVSEGPVFIEHTRRSGERIASPEAAAIIADILSDNDARAHSFGLHSALALNHRVAVKTGTSSGFRDAWTVGFTRDHTVAVWVGNPDGRPMRETLAIRAAAPLWAAIIGELLQTDAPVEAATPSPRLVQREICRATGLLPAPESPARLTEWFLAGTEPTEDAAAHFVKDPTDRPHLILPQEYAAWCQSGQNSIGAICPAAEKLAILQPVPHAAFTVDPALPRSQQMLELACTGGLGRDVHWFVNDREVARRGNGRVYWPLTEGSWRISARAGEEKAEVSITVE